MATQRGYVDAVVEGLEKADDDWGMLPTLLMVACVDVLPVAGAGLSVMSDIRLPLGASDTDAVLAEQLQVSLGSGPCLAAATAGEPTVSDEQTIAHRWPVYYEDLVRQTPYRSVMSLTLTLGGYIGALDLYSTDPTAATLPALDEVLSVVGEPIAELMRDVPPVEDRAGLLLPGWLVNKQVERRLNVWIAVGMVMEHHCLTSRDALALLRAYGYGSSRTLDSVSDDVVAGRLRASELGES